MLKVELTRQYNIKPSSPTPQRLRTHRLSWFDQHAYNGYGNFILFYSRTTIEEEEEEEEEALSMLKRSLSQTLTIYYPLAGRMSENSLEIECNDQGVDFFEARCTTANLSQLLLPFQRSRADPDFESLGQLVPRGRPCGPLLLLQVTTFACGGLAIGLCLSHKIADGTSVAEFIKTWAAVASGAKDGGIPCPNFSAATVFPPSPNSPMSSPQDSEALILMKIKVAEKVRITRRFLLSDTKIAALRAPTSTRAVAVMALMWRCCMRARAASQLAVVSLVSLRQKLSCPDLPDALFGNLVTEVIASAKAETWDDERSKNEMEEKLRSGIRSVGWEHVRKQMKSERRASAPLAESRERPLALVSWLRFSLYEADFGWGKPVWIGTAGPYHLNTVLLLDGYGNEGMEAWVTLEEKEMRKLEQDEELLSYIC